MLVMNKDRQIVGYLNRSFPKSPSPFFEFAALTEEPAQFTPPFGSITSAAPGAQADMQIIRLRRDMYHRGLEIDEMELQRSGVSPGELQRTSEEGLMALGAALMRRSAHGSGASDVILNMIGPAKVSVFRDIHSDQLNIRLSYEVAIAEDGETEQMLFDMKEFLPIDVDDFDEEQRASLEEIICPTRYKFNLGPSPTSNNMPPYGEMALMIPRSVAKITSIS